MKNVTILSLSLLLFSACKEESPDKSQKIQNDSACGGYEFRGGYPTEAAAKKSYDELDMSRALVAYHFFYPTVSMESTFQGNRDANIEDSKSAFVMACGPRHVLFTGNSDTPYMGADIDLRISGPIVIELPPGPYLGIINDHNFRWVADIGLPGPDAGKGGKHLILPPGFDGAIPKGYYVSKSATYKILIAARALPANGDVSGALAAQRNVKVYPLSSASSPRLIELIDKSNDKIDISCLRFENNIQYWEKLHKAIEEEPPLEQYRAMYGVLATLGIEKGKPFAPDARMKRILEEAAKRGRDQMLVAAFASGRSDKIVWPDRKWEWAALRWENGDFDLPTGPDLEARDHWFSQAVGTSPKMFLRTAGAGSLYWLGLRDKNGNYLEGSKNYKLTVPQPVPQKLFWSVTVYDAETRSQIQTEQDKAALRSLFELKSVSKTEPTVLYFGPQAPSGKEGQWIKTIQGKGWFVYLRLYGPDGPAFDGTWKPGDFEEIE